MVVVFGDEPFLKRQALNCLRTAMQAEHDAPFATFDGTAAEWRDVADELSTRALFGGGGPRLAVVSQADDFVTRFREKLEDYVNRSKHAGILVLDVGTWASNTRLYKATDQHGLQIECRAPQKAAGKGKVLDEARLAKWLSFWAASQHRVKLPAKAASLILELVGPEFGLLDQELAKLALFAGLDGSATLEMVRDVVGGWRTKTVWEMLDSGVGRPDSCGPPATGSPAAIRREPSGPVRVDRLEPAAICRRHPRGATCRAGRPAGLCATSPFGGRSSELV